MIKKITNFKVRDIQIILPEPTYIDVDEDGTISGVEGWMLALVADSLAQMAERLREKNNPNNGTDRDTIAE